MSIASMTGFASRGGDFKNFQWVWELKSVNGKGLDVRLRVPNWLEGFEVEGKKEISKTLTRGSVFAKLDLNREDSGETVTVNKEILDQLLDIAHEYEAQPALKPATLDGLLRIKGVLNIQDVKLSSGDINSLKIFLLGELVETTKQLVDARKDEGQKLEAIISSQIDELEKLVIMALKTEGAGLANIKQKLNDKVNDLLGDKNRLSSERVEQEVALLAVKADIREEIDRLKAHIESAKDLILKGGPLGRKLDFLCQELNRETNTICSKSGDIELTQIGLAMKVLVDQFREQIQNIE